MASEDLFIKMVLDAWQTHIKRTDELLYSLSDEQLMNEIAPGRNRGVYLLGHLAAVHDRIPLLLELGNPLYPELWHTFVEKPDKEVTELPATQALRQHWKEINLNLAGNMQSLLPEAWFKKHSSVSAEDFAKEPHRNRLSVLLNRTNHLSYHYGQLAFLKK